jgi:cell wall-associated NlpC family hydrolase
MKLPVIMLLLACVAFTASGAEARQKITVSKKSTIKKPAAATNYKAKKSVRIKNSELPALPPKSFVAGKKPGSGESLINSANDRQLRSELERYLGTRYKRGGTGGDGFDCSGFARSMYRKLFNVDLPHKAQ